MSTQIGITVRLMPEYPKAKMPEYAHNNDIAADLFSAEEETVIVPPHFRRAIHTGVQMAFPKGYGALLEEKSGLALKQGISIMAGVIDEGYRGEILVIVHNTSHHAIEIQPLQKIAQIRIIPILQGIFSKCEKFSDSTERGEHGFGSTGV